MKKRLLSQKDAVLIYTLGFVIMLVTNIIAVSVIPKESDLYIYASYFLPQISYLIAIIVYPKTANVEYQLNLKENARKNKYRYLLALLFGAGLFFCALLFNYLQQKFFRAVGYNGGVTVPALNGPFDYVLSAFIVCLIPSVIEELMFRKTFADGMSRIGEINACLLAAAVFSLAHFNPVQTIYQFILGFILAFLYIKTGDIVITIIIHIANNALAFFLESLTDSALWAQPKNLLLAFGVGLPIAAASFYLILKGSGKVNNKREEKISPYIFILIGALLVIWIANLFLQEKI